MSNAPVKVSTCVVGGGKLATALASRIRDTGERVDTARAFAPQDTLVTPQSHDIVVCALEDVTLQKIFDVVDECLRRDIGCLLVVVTGARIQVGPVITVSNRPLLERISQGLSRASNEDNQPAEKLRFMKVHDTAIVDAQCLSAAADYVANLMQTGWSDQYWKSRVFGPQGISEQSHFNDESLQLIASHAPRLQGSATYDAAASLHRLTAGLVLPQRAQIESIGIVGGGTAGYLTALALKKFYPRKRITLLESSQIPVIGVGEATTPLMVAFLHNILGLDPVELYQAVRPTWKLGIRFEWGPNRRSHFNYPFGQFDPYPAQAFGENINACGLHSMMMDACTSPLVERSNGSILSLLNQMQFAYHLDNQPFVEYLQRCASRAGVEHVDCKITEVRTDNDAERIETLISKDGREFSYDVYVDCTGFRSNLLGKELNTPFHSYASSLFTDSAVIATVPHGGTIKPYTTATTMNSGWCWNIPQFEEDHIGYVYSSTHCDPERATDEILARYPGAESLKPVRFRSGRHEDFFKGNVAAVGNSYGFVEPLESTGLHDHSRDL